MNKLKTISLMVLIITIASIGLLYVLTNENPHDISDFDEDNIASNQSDQFTGLSDDDLDRILEKGTIRVLVPYNRTDFYLLNGQPTGFQVDLVEEYLKYINTKYAKTIATSASKNKASKPLSVIYLPTTFDQLIEDLVLGRGDIVASNISATPERLSKITIASELNFSRKEVVISNRNTQISLNNLNDLSGKKITVMAGSSYVNSLQELNKVFAQEEKPLIEIDVADREFSEVDILELVDAGIVNITIVDSYKARLWMKVLPNIKTHSKLVVKEHKNIGWAIRKNNPALLSSIESFQKTIKKGTLTGNFLFKKYYQDSTRIKNLLVEELSADQKKAIALITKYSKQYNFNALATIALAYQESFLKQEKVSDKGAIGVMQILPSTALDMGFEDVSTIENNVHAGIKYLDFLRKNYISQLPLDKNNQYAFLWAAYNAGPGRIPTIREKTVEMGLDENIWFSNAEFAALDILGKETATYVANVYKYFLIYQSNQEVTPIADIVAPNQSNKSIAIPKKNVSLVTQ